MQAQDGVRTVRSFPPRSVSVNSSPTVEARKRGSSSTKTEEVARVSSEPIVPSEKEAVRLRKSDVFDLDLVKRRDSRPKASVYMMEKKGRDRVRKAALNVLLFPLHLAWWRRRVPAARPYLYRLSCLYLLHGLSVARELFMTPTDTPVEFVELMLPFLLLVVMSILMGQAAASSFPPLSTDKISKVSQAKTIIGNESTASSEPSARHVSPARSEGSTREKSRKLKRRLSKSENGSLPNDSTNETLTNEDDEDDTGSSEEEEETTDSSSDSSGDESKKQHRPHVAVRRSSLLGTPTSPQALGPHATIGMLSPEVLGARQLAGILSSGGPKQVKPIANGLPPKPPSASSLQASATSPTNQSTKQSKRAHRRNRFFPNVRISRYNTDPNVSAKDASFVDQGDDSDTDEDELDHDDSVIYHQEGKTAGENEIGHKTLHRNRLFSQSMDDLLDAVKSVHWSAHGPEKLFLTPSQIRLELERKIFELRMSDNYRHFALICAIAVALIPTGFRSSLFGAPLYCRFVNLPFIAEILSTPTYCESCQAEQFLDDCRTFFYQIFGVSILDVLGISTSALATFILAYILLGSVACTVETFKRRYLYAKFFSKLTSSRKARRAGIPYFHLHKVDHIKVWLSLRSRRTDLDRESLGPYAASDTIAHFLFMVAIFLVGVVAFRAMQNVSGGSQNGRPAGGALLSTMADWVLFAWAFILAVFVQRIMILAQKTHERFQNTSVLLTEELNIHMRLLRKPEKKDELNACNQMLKVASALIKELEGPKSKKGMAGTLILDPWLYSIVRVVLLSALGALSSDLFGFRVRLWKI